MACVHNDVTITFQMSFLKNIFFPSTKRSTYNPRNDQNQVFVMVNLRVSS